MKSLDRKLADIQNNRDSRAFIIADAKDPDMAYGVRALNPQREAANTASHQLPVFGETIRKIVRQGIVDIMLMSASVSERLTIEERLFERSAVTPAARANDTTDIWAIRHGRYVQEPSRPFRSASIDAIQCGQVDCPPGPFPGANLGLYSITFVNEPVADRKTLEAFREFREEAERKGFRYFLEVFNPNVPAGVPDEKLGEFVNDQIVRSLAGVTESGRPLFLKIAWNGPRAMEELAGYDPRMIVGVLGGSAGTSHDAFCLLHDARQHGARVALFGRKINRAEHQLAFIEMLRLIADGTLRPPEAVTAYHDVLRKLKIRPRLALEQDLELTDPVLLRDRSATGAATARTSTGAAAKRDSPTWPVDAEGRPVFSRMNAEQRRTYDRHRLRRIYG